MQTGGTTANNRSLPWRAQQASAISAECPAPLRRPLPGLARPAAPPPELAGLALSQAGVSAGRQSDTPRLRNGSRQTVGREECGQSQERKTQKYRAECKAYSPAAQGRLRKLEDGLSRQDLACLTRRSPAGPGDVSGPDSLTWTPAGEGTRRVALMQMSCWRAALRGFSAPGDAP